MRLPELETAMDGENLGDRCGNCGGALSGEYCSACGQRRAERLSLRRTIGDGLERLVELDFALARTFAGLCRRPGQLVLDYVGGHRLAYSNPFRYAFVVTTLCVIAIHLLDIDVTAPGVPVETERERAAVQLVTSLTAYLFFPAVLLLAGLQRLLRRRPGFNYAELLVFDAFCIGHGSLIAVLVGPVLPPGTPAGLSLILGLQTAYLAWCQRGFRAIRWGEAVGRALLLLVGYVVVFNVIALLVINAVAIAGLL
jgi:hypothetical protein